MGHFEDYTWVSGLLAKVREGGLTEEEKVRLQSWRDADVENELLYGRVLTEGWSAGKREEWGRVDSEGAYGRLWEQLRLRGRRRLWGRVVGVVAGVLLAAGMGLYAWLGGAGQVEEEVRRLAAVEILPGSARAELILAGGERLVLGDEPVDTVWLEEGMELRTTGEQLSYAGGGSGEVMQYNTLRVPRGGEFAVELSDGTRVRLNSDSELRYPVRFLGDERRVYLSGEGYFEVSEDMIHPFVVEVRGREVEVLGTVFNVCAYDEEEGVATTLVEGRVRFTGEGGSVELEVGEQGVSDGDGRLEKRRVDVYDYVAWQKGQFVFRKRTLEDVMRVVSRWYNVDVVFEWEGAKGISFTGSMRRYGDFAQVVRLLEMTGGLDFRIEGRTIYISER